MQDLGQFMEIKSKPRLEVGNYLVHVELSASEAGRIQRAFCRFEIYRYLFARCSSDWDHKLPGCLEYPIFSPEVQAKRFLDLLPDFQAVEIHCVRDYLVRSLREILYQIEDEMLEILSPDDFFFYDCDDIREEAHYLFSRKGNRGQGEYIEHLISLGLALVRQIFEATGEKRRNLFIRRNTEDWWGNDGHLDSSRHFLTEAFKEMSRNPANISCVWSAGSDLNFSYNIHPNIPQDIPAAWQWAHPEEPPSWPCTSSYKGLRNWGYVFWDHHRLQESGILQRDSEEMRLLYYDEENIGPGNSVEERLRMVYHFPENPPMRFDSQGRFMTEGQYQGVEPAHPMDPSEVDLNWDTAEIVESVPESSMSMDTLSSSLEEYSGDGSW